MVESDIDMSVGKHTVIGLSLKVVLRYEDITSTALLGYMTCGNLILFFNRTVRLIVFLG